MECENEERIADGPKDGVEIVYRGDNLEKKEREDHRIKTNAGLSFLLFPKITPRKTTIQAMLALL